jgi:hypothetical protein
MEGVMTIDIPGLGATTKDERFGWLYSTEMKVKVLFNSTCRVVVEGYEDDEDKGDFHAAIKNFLEASESVLKACEPFIFQYYQDINSNWSPGDEEYIDISSPENVWKHVSLGNEPMVSRRPYGDRGIYVSLECNCDWEPEHGLQLVFKNGQKVNKVGSYDGHLTNSDAWADDSLEDVVYR